MCALNDVKKKITNKSFFVLVKAFLAKAKDEFQVKYDRPNQVGL
jgi:hypothetical protein